MTIPEDALSSLELEVKDSMAEGRWQEALLTIRATASELGVDSDQLTKAVARRAIELGHVRPLQQVEVLEG